MFIARKDNVVYKISEEQKEFYTQKGFDIFDEKGKPLKEPEKPLTAKEVAKLKAALDKATAENDALKAENDALKAEIKALTPDKAPEQ